MATTTPTSDLSSFLGAYPDINRLYDNVQAVANGVTLPLLQMALWNTIDEFYRRSTGKRELVFFQLNPGETEVNFDPFDANWRVAWVNAWRAGGAGDGGESQGATFGFGWFRGKIIPPATLRDITFPTPQTTRNGSALISLVPVNFDSVASEDFLWSQWFEAILAGTLMRLHSMPDRPFTNPQLAAVQSVQYSSGIRQARGLAQKQWSDSGGRWAYPYFARGRRY